MGISSSLYAGISGLNANGNAMSVIGNNLANTNTVGFKSGRTVFADMLSSSISGSGGASQVGRGVTLSTVDNIFSQGTFETTESNTDLALEGEGFFVVSAAGSKENLYTRAGAFGFDKQGYLVNPEGYRVQGYPYDDNETLLSTLGDIRVDGTSTVPAKATAEMTLSNNLDSNSAIIPGGFSLADPQGTSNYSSSIQVYDSLGNTHLLTTYFTKTADNEWDWNTVALGSEVVGVDPATEPLLLLDKDPAAILSFNSDGALTAPVTTSLTMPAWLGGSEADVSVDINFNATQYARDSSTVGQEQDGFSAGDLVKVAIETSGDVVASYTNGERVAVGRIGLARFANIGGLFKEGGNLYSATTASGLPSDAAASTKIFTNSLEQSNVDMGLEFVKMITTQRGFQANSKIITTTDEMLAELINLKR
ncbi:MAG: flagellar hook protein FlgE [Desulfuromonadales bacterium]|nr:flagellar hook protein FlgE [Desulfuromonadales bacterium]MDW7757264.1 flagellar hook protein FlgE [Desulfuromonadales bacterium]